MAKPRKPKPAEKPPASKEGNSRPDLRIVCASKGDEERTFIPLAAFWKDPDTGYFRGGLDGRVKGIVIVTADGTRINVKNAKDGEYYVNAYHGKASPKARKPPKGGEGTGGDEDFGDDDIPF